MFARMADAKVWAKRVAAWRSSGQTAETFSAGRGFAPSTLRWWSWQLQPRGRAEAELVRVMRAPEPPAASPDRAMEIEKAGARVLVRAGFDREVLGEIIEVLRGGGGA
jgi:hypothetical protein